MPPENNGNKPAHDRRDKKQRDVVVGSETTGLLKISRISLGTDESKTEAAHQGPYTDVQISTFQKGSVNRCINLTTN